MGKYKCVHLRRNVRRKVFLCFLAVVLLLSAGLPAQAADTYAAAKPATTREIAIVFDNSGSMYIGGNTAWCRAIYAMEVFASMLNEGDTLRIYPMWDIEARGTTYSRAYPLTVSGGGGDPSVIREIYTPIPQRTPIEAIDDAFYGLQGSGADEQWLIVLTDGTQFDQNNEDLADTVGELSSVLSEYNQSVNVMYLGIGEEAAIPAVSGSYKSQVEKAGDSADVLSRLTTMGNNIFGRDEMPNVGQAVSFDVSLSKLIVFIQGDNIGNVTLTDPQGQACAASSIYTPSYGTRGADNYWDQEGPFDTPDTSLSGTLVTYENLDAGSYSLDYSGNSLSVSAYYEPDVRVAVSLSDADGQPLSENSDLSPGTYYLSYSLVDKDGAATSSALLGSVDYEFDVNVSGSVQHISAREAGSTALELSGGDSMTVEGDVAYLSGYNVHITNEDVAGMADPFLIPERELYVTLTGGEASYPLSQLEQQAVYNVTLSNDDGPILGDALDRAEVTLDVPGLDYTCSRNGDSFDVTLNYPNGNAVETVCQEYTVRASAVYTDEKGQEQSGLSEPLSFAIEDDTYGLSVEMDVQQREYILSRLGNAKPILLTLTEDGQPLDDAALENVSLQFTVTDKKGNAEDWSDAFTAAIVPGKSQYQVQLNKGANVGTGKHTVTCTATTVDNIGQEISGTDQGKVTIRRMPIWIPILIGLLLVGLLAFLVWKFFDMPVLPKEISASDASFTLDGDKKPGHVSLTFTKQSARQGTIDIGTSNHPLYKGVNGAIALAVTAASPRRVNPTKRKITVTEVTGGRRVTRVKLGGTSLNRGEDGKFTPAHSKNAAALAVTMQNNSTCDFSISGVTATGEDVSGPAKMKFTFK